MNVTPTLKEYWKEYRYIRFCEVCGKDYGSDFKARGDNGFCHTCEYHHKRKEAIKKAVKKARGHL